MATWGDLEKMTHEQMANFTHGELERLTKEQIQRFIDEVWPVLVSLAPTEREAFRRGLLDQTLPPALLADRGTDYTPTQAAALKIWATQPMTRAEVATWLQVILALIAIMQTQLKDDPAPEPPPAVVVQIEMPEHYHELPEHYRQLPKETDPLETSIAPEPPVISPADRPAG